MPLRRSTTASQAFSEQLQRLRANIELLGEHFQPQLQAFANQIEEHHEFMQHECAIMHDLVDDMRLREACVKFNIWAMETP